MAPTALQKYSLSTVLWGDRTLEASLFADRQAPHRYPLASDPSWNDMVDLMQSPTLGHIHDGVIGAKLPFSSILPAYFDFLVVGSTISYDANAVSNNGASGTTPTVSVNTTTGDETIIVISLANPSATVTAVSDGAGTPFVLRGVKNNNTGTARVEIWSGPCALGQSPATITVSLSANSDWVLSSDSYFGIQATGNIVTNAGNTSQPTVTVTTQDKNNFVVAGFADPSNLVLTALSDNLQTQGHQGTTITGAIADRTSVNPLGLTVAVKHGVTAKQWASVGVEYRTTPPNGTVLNAHDPLIKFVDLNGSGAWDPGEPVIYDADSDNTYSAGDTVIAGTAPVLGQPLKLDTRLVYLDLFLAGTWLASDPVILDTNANLIYDSTLTISTLGRLIVGENAMISGSLTVNGTGSFGGTLSSRQISMTGTLPVTLSPFIHLNDQLVTQIQQNMHLVQGLAFQPIMDNILGSVVVDLFQPILSYPTIRIGVGGTGITVTEIDNVTAGMNLIGAINIPTYIALLAQTPIQQLGGPSTIGVYYGLYVQPAPTFATTKYGIFQAAASDVNRVVANTRHGDSVVPTRTMEINGGLAIPVVTKTGNYTALLTDHYILGDATGGAITITLPASNSAFANSVSQRISIKKKDSSINAVTIAAAGADTIQGAASVALAAQYSERTLYTDGSGTWYVESSI